MDADGQVDYEDFVPEAVDLLVRVLTGNTTRHVDRNRGSAPVFNFQTPPSCAMHEILSPALVLPPPPPPPPENTMRSMEDLKEYSSEDLKEYLRRLFSIGDTNGDGVLQPSEFKRLLELSGFNFSEETVRQLMSAADVNGDGVIEYDEFIPVGMEVLKAQNKQWSRQPATPPTLPSLKDIAPEVSMID